MTEINLSERYARLRGFALQAIVEDVGKGLMMTVDGPFYCEIAKTEDGWKWWALEFGPAAEKPDRREFEGDVDDDSEGGALDAAHQLGTVLGRVDEQARGE